MTAADWHDDGLRSFGMFVSGDPLRSPGPHGEQLHDTSFTIWLNSSARDVELTLPRNNWVRSGEIVLSTDPAHPIGKPLEAGSTMVQEARSVIVMRETKS